MPGGLDAINLSYRGAGELAGEPLVDVVVGKMHPLKL
jgi:hypothetical protein